ncbi:MULTISPECIES: phage tail tape measure protein [Clostridium]|uniref:phage tail tape measure protein n=1 Tax=Clostridium TaxID=1485 RepID=UPI00077309B4|nr:MULTISPECIES: phage tail tape measure protein [Clostridium]AUM96145.1 phage tail tape measure protein [Clostridium sporogenes]AVQ53596.1 phage tail tape measure protein [Clostridium botulinum]
MAGGIQLAPLITQMKVDLKSFKSDMDKVKTEAVGKAKEVSKSMESAAKVGKKMSDIGGTMTKKVTLPIVAAGTAAAKFSMDFHQSLAKVSTIADTTKVPIGTLKDGVIDLSTKTGMAATDLNEALYQAISGSVDTADAVDFLGVAVKAAEGGFTDTATAVDGLTTVLNSYGMEADKADKIANQMLITQNLGKTTFGELASSVGKITPIAAQLGITTEELFSSLASTTAQGLATSESVTALKAAMSNIIKPSKEASEAAEQLGIDFSVSALQSKGWMGFLQDVKKGLSNASPEFDKLSKSMSDNAHKMLELENAGKKGTKEYKELSKAQKNASKDLELMAQAADSPIGAFATMFGSVEGLNSILMLTSDNGAAKYNESMEEMKTNTTALNDAFNKMDKTPGKEMKKALNDIKILGIEMGDILMPVIRDVIKDIRGMAQGFKSLNPHTKEAIVKTALFAATMGPLLSATGKTITAFTKLKPVVSGAAVAFKSGSPIIKAFTKNLLKSKGTSEAFSLAMKKGTPFLGKFLSKLGLTKTVGAEASKALISVEGAAGTAAGATGVGGLLSSLGGLAVAAVPWVAGAAMVGTAAYGIHKTLSTEVVPSVDLFADKIKTSNSEMMNYHVASQEIVTANVKISESTKKAVGAYMELDRGVSDTLYSLQIKTKTTNQEVKRNMVDKFVNIANNYADINKDMKTKVIKEITEMTSGGKQLTGDMVKEMESKLNQLLNSSNNISKEQKEKVLSEYREIYTQSGIITEEISQQVTSKFNQMRDQVINTENDKYNKLKEEAQKFFNENSALTLEEQQKALNNLTLYHNESIGDTQESYARINEIIAQAASEGRQVNANEQAEINILRETSKNRAIDILSEQEAEAAVIKERMKSYNGRVTAEMASQMITKANETRDKTIAAAEKQYDDQVKAAYKLEKAGAIDAEQRDRMIKKAEETKKSQIESANKACEGVKTEISNATPGIEREVNTQTGTIKTPYDNLKESIGGFFSWLFGQNEKAKEEAKYISPHYMGTHYNGLSYVPKDGYIARLHKGERVLTAEENRDYTQGNINGKGINVTNNFYGRVDSPYEVSKATKKSMRDLSFA